MSKAAKEIDLLEDKINWHWRNSMQPVRFIAFDARAALPLPLVLLRLVDWRVWMIFILNLLFFRFLERRGLTFPAALRSFRAWIVGKKRPGLVGALKNKFVDYV